MKEKTSKLITWIVLILGLVATGLAIGHAMGSDPKHVLEAGTMTELGNSNSVLYDIAYIIMILFAAVAIVAIFYFVIVRLINIIRAGGGKKLLIVLIAIIAVCATALLTAKGDDVSSLLLEKNSLSLFDSKLIGAACIGCYIIVIGAAISIIYVEVSKLFKRK